MTTPASTSPLDQLYAALHASPVTRSSDRVVAGVCAGLAERTGLSVGVVRLLTVVLAVLGPAVLLYLLAWVLLPAPDGRVRLEQALREGDAASVALLVLTALVLVPDALFSARMPWLPVVAVGVVAFLAWRRGRCGASLGWSQGRGAGGAAPSAGPGHRGEDGTPQDAPRS